MKTLLAPQTQLFGPARLVGLGDDELSLAIIPKHQADAIIRAGHYSGSVCWASSFHFGVFEGDDVLGALQFGPLMNPASANSIVADSDSSTAIELNRMWLADDKPANTASRAIAWAIRIIRSQRPHVEWVQAFADERCGKFGAVYQAASFLYCGEHSTTFYELDGEWFHKSAIGRRDKRGWGVGPKITYFNANLGRAIPHTFRQFRYVRPLTRSARRRLLLPVLPYPKGVMP